MTTCEGLQRSGSCEAKTNPGIRLCEKCQQTTTYALTNIATYYADLDLVPTMGVKRRGNTAADPTGIAAAHIIRDPVAEIDDETLDTLARWARRLHAGRAPRAVPDLAPWLTRHLSTIVTTAWAGEMLRDLLRLERRLRKVAARADTGQYVGTCDNEIQPELIHDQQTCACACHLDEAFACDVPGGCGVEYAVLEAQLCGHPLYAPRDTHSLKCRGCGSFWDVRARRQALVRKAEDELAPVAVIAHLAALWIGEPSVAKVEGRIRIWVHRKRIRHVTTKVIDGRDRKVYRVGDVLDLLTDTPTKAAESRTA